MAGVVLEDLTKRYDGGALAVNKLNLDIHDGEFVCLVGPSGCGKTTALRMIAGLEEISSGQVRIGDRVVNNLPPRDRDIAMVFQSYALYPHMSVRDNMAFGLQLRKLPSAEVRRRVGEMLEVVRLTALSRRYPAELSGGQQQRVALARAIVIQPSVLLLDEPLSNLDANLREEMRGEIRRLHDAFRITTVHVTHDQAEAMVTSERIAVMNQGRIEQVDDPHTLYTRPRTRFVAGFIGRTNFVEGSCNGEQVAFDRFALPRARFEGGAALEGKVVFSIRPQSLRLHRAPPAVRDFHVEVRVIERAYLGEFWDYVVVPCEGALRLKVTAPPLEVYGVGDAAWLELDPRQMAAIR